MHYLLSPHCPLLRHNPGAADPLSNASQPVVCLWTLKPTQISCSFCVTPEELHSDKPSAGGPYVCHRRFNLIAQALDKNSNQVNQDIFLQASWQPIKRLHNA
jgi:hypothetical protein